MPPPQTPSLLLFMGDNTFALAEELRRWKSAFQLKHGEANLLILEARTLDWGELRSEVQTAPFISGKRLIIIEGIPTVEKEDMEDLLASRHEATILVFAENKPDRRKSVVKLLEKEAVVRAFPMLTPKQLVPWVQELARLHGITILPEVAAHLVARVGSDQWHLRNELLKLISFCSSNDGGDSLRHAEPLDPSDSSAEAGKLGVNSVSTRHGELRRTTKHVASKQETSTKPHSPTVCDVDLICLPSETHAVWAMNDLIGKGNLKGAVEHAARLAASGEDAFSLWNIFLYSIRTLALLHLHVQENPQLSAGALAKTAGVHPLSVSALLPLVRALSPEQLLRIVESAVEADIALKTGALRATAQDPIELQCMLEKQILGLAKS